MTEKDAPFSQPTIEGLEIEQPEDSAAEELAVSALSRHIGPNPDPYAAERRRQEEIIDRRGEDLRQEQTGVPSIPAEQTELGTDIDAVRPPLRRKQAVIRGRQAGDSENDGGQSPTYHSPAEENIMTNKHRDAARRNLPYIKEKLAHLQSPDDESKNK